MEMNAQGIPATRQQALVYTRMSSITRFAKAMMAISVRASVAPASALPEYGPRVIAWTIPPVQLTPAIRQSDAYTRPLLSAGTLPRTTLRC